MITIRLDSPTPLGVQIAEALRAHIASGTLAPGDELPPVRQLAADLGVNLNTVARAYRELEGQGLLTSVRGRGTRVASSRAQTVAPMEETHEALRRVLTAAKLGRQDRKNVRALFDQLLTEVWPA